MTSTSQPETPFSRALRQWILELEHDQGKKTLFYEKVLTVRNDLSGISGHEACAKYAKELSDYIQVLETTKRKTSKSLKLCLKLEPFVNSIASLMNTCGNLVQEAHIGIQVAFSGARLVLYLAAALPEIFNKIVDIMVEISRNLKYYDKLSVAYETSEDVQELLLDVYKTIIGFWNRASQVLSRNSIRISASSLANPIESEWKTCLDKLQRNSQAVLALVQATNATESRENQALHLTKRIAKWIMGGEDASKLLCQNDLVESRNMRQDGTCNWIFEDSIFESWYKASKNVVAWYNAPPGSGKTVLSAAIAHHLERTDQFVYYRYSFDDNTRSSPLSAIRSIALQLRSITGNVPDLVKQKYHQEVERHIYQLQDLEIATEVMQEFIKAIPKVHIIVDGLDECSDVRKCLELFRKVIQFKTYGITKWFFTSCDLPIIGDFMEDIQCMKISPAPGVIMRDITTFLDAQQNQLVSKKCVECIQYWTATSEENFLYSKLMFDIICGNGVTCNDEIIEELNKFPLGLVGCYTRCLHNLSTRTELERNLARRMFVFLVCTLKPLTINELRNALAIKIGERYDDYQPGRVPSLELVKSLGGSLIRLESSEDENDDCRIKFVHKSVLDFLKEDPEKLGIASNRPDLRYFFIDEKEGHLEIGRSCLKYLQFKRYQAKVDMPTVLSNRDEHAFLRYSAAFWFEHLQHINHSTELFSEVKSFSESLSFWTCLAVQLKVRPHLFARYTGIGGTSFVPGTQRGTLDINDNIAIPLPHWIEAYKPEGYRISRKFYDFIREWHEVLVSYPEASDQCMIDGMGKDTFPGVASMMSKMIRMSTINAPKKSLTPTLESVFFRKSKLYTRITYLDESTACWQEGPISASEPSEHGIITMLAPDHKKPGELIRFNYNTQTSSSSHSVIWSFSLQSLDARRFSSGETVAFTATKPGFILEDPKDLTKQWHLVVESQSGTYRYSAFSLHLRNAGFGGTKKRESDSGYNTDSDSEHDWSSSDDESSDDLEHDTNHETMASDCLVICCSGEKPLWIPWTEQSTGQQISCAFHPLRQVAVYSLRLGQLQVIDLSTGHKSCLEIEEPAAASVSAPIECREMRFSPCGKYLYYLLIMISDSGGVGSTCQAFLSVFPFGEPGEDSFLQPCAETQRLTYKFRLPIDRLRAPYVLSHWDPDMLYLCLPLLFCNPKVARFHLKGESQPGSEEMQIRTLANPIFFPNSTPSRSPRILYRSSRTSSKDIFVLALDSSGQIDQGGGEDSYPPVVLEWKIDREEGWRIWNEDSDGEEPMLVEESKTYAQLRGDFIAADRRFNVVVRNGLDWTRKAFLSCT
ncbi:hypothetical protein F4810DRAFT_102735 [Camillea tinctor]|nr:hypothetical protein F4810DRAFT_102735 [Camillea tinctor]